MHSPAVMRTFINIKTVKTTDFSLPGFPVSEEGLRSAVCCGLTGLYNTSPAANSSVFSSQAAAYSSSLLLDPAFIWVCTKMEQQAD